MLSSQPAQSPMRLKATKVAVAIGAAAGAALSDRGQEPRAGRAPSRIRSASIVGYVLLGPAPRGCRAAGDVILPRKSGPGLGRQCAPCRSVICILSRNASGVNCRSPRCRHRDPGALRPAWRRRRWMDAFNFERVEEALQRRVVEAIWPSGSSRALFSRRQELGDTRQLRN